MKIKNDPSKQGPLGETYTQVFITKNEYNNLFINGGASLMFRDNDRCITPFLGVKPAAGFVGEDITDLRGRKVVTLFNTDELYIKPLKETKNFLLNVSGYKEVEFINGLEAPWNKHVMTAIVCLLDENGDDYQRNAVKWYDKFVRGDDDALIDDIAQLFSPEIAYNSYKIFLMEEFGMEPEPKEMYKAFGGSKPMISPPTELGEMLFVHSEPTPYKLLKHSEAFKKQLGPDIASEIFGT
ncbi:MAG: hypothetical protein GXO24_04115 [Chlorobi bacterium]|nr:hypothetical protein [Chlorobiota bacterium]